MMSDNEHMTFAERLDASESGEEFGDVLKDLFRTLEAD
jgi:hypothetical protein